MDDDSDDETLKGNAKANTTVLDHSVPDHKGPSPSCEAGTRVSYLQALESGEALIAAAVFGQFFCGHGFY